MHSAQKNIRVPVANDSNRATGGLGPAFVCLECGFLVPYVLVTAKNDISGPGGKRWRSHPVCIWQAC